MNVKWKNGFNPEVIVGKLSNIRTIDGEKVSFIGFDYNEYISVLKSMIDVDENISTEIAHGLIVKGFHEAAKKSELTTKNVISSVKKAVREYLGKPDKAYWLVTTLNIHNSNDLPIYRINGCSLCFYKNLPKKYREARQEFITDVEGAIVRYVRALDSHDYNSAFIKLWSVLEYLTHTLKDSYDKTIKRAAFQYQDREYARQVLEHLRQYRNKSVHLSAGESDIEAHVYQLKSYVEQLLRFHIGNHFKFGSLEEAAKFMDLPSDIDALKKQIALYQAGIKFMEG